MGMGVANRRTIMDHNDTAGDGYILERTVHYTFSPSEWLDVISAANTSQAAFDTEIASLHSSWTTHTTSTDRAEFREQVLRFKT